ncbi:MAG: ankyrin repeat-containing protein [Elusimicrobia bacterium]|nr:MAG: ankyrin repeat-containing protein [Elusimicrobiota bacterium]
MRPKKATWKADAGFVRFLLKRGADFRLTAHVDYGAWYEHHGLSSALSSGDLDKVKALLEAGADIRYVRKGGFDALMDAAMSAPGGPRAKEARLKARHRSLLEFLLTEGVPVSGKSEKGQTALTILSKHTALEAAQLLVRAGADEAPLKWTPLHKAVAYGTPGDVAARLEADEPLEPKDHDGRTPLVLAVQLGELEKAKLLAGRGADKDARWLEKFSLLELAVSEGHAKLVEWLAAGGADVDAESEYGFTPLTNAVMSGSTELVKILLAAGADVHKAGKHGAAPMKEADTLPMIRLLSDAGADTGALSNAGRRAYVGLPPDADIELLTASPEEYARAKHPRRGEANPEEAVEPFWTAMLRAGVNAYSAKEKYGDKSAPVWCAERFGQSLTSLPDGRILLIGGEHEDGYMPDFYIYNDVFVFEPGGKVRVFLYSDQTFPPTDGHSATLAGDWVYVIGNVGYQDAREEGVTPVYRLNTKTLSIEQVATSGANPGWIGRHRARLIGSRIEVVGGQVHRVVDGKRALVKNEESYSLDLADLTWHRRTPP